VVPDANTEQRKLAAIMFTDMVGYSALTQRNEALALELLGEHHGILRAILPRHQGGEIKSTGDGLLVEFPSALAAVQCAVEIQRVLAGRNAREARERWIRIRIGIHLGDVVWHDNDMLGDGVNIAARIEPLADPGGICVSRAVFEQIENKLSLPMVELNNPALKNISAKVQVFKLLLDDVQSLGPAPPPPESAGHKPRLWLAVLGVVVAAVAALVVWHHAAPVAGVAPVSAPGIAVGASSDDALILQILQPIVKKYDLPGMALAVVTDNGIKWAGCAGVRKRGLNVPVDLNDQWYIGADSKMMTSVLVSRLVERGQLRWDTTLGQVFPEMNSMMNPTFQKVTLLQLLSHHAGMPTNFLAADYPGQDVEAQRLRVVREALSQPPGPNGVYSDLGYIVAGAVVERITGKSWERAITDEVFNPLKMKSAGFGGVGTPGLTDQPWPHGADGQPAAQNGPDSDNLPVFGPAGRIHCSLQDWAAFIQDQLRGARGESAFLQPDSYRRLQTPPFDGNLALGWMVVQRNWAGGQALCHGGRTTISFSSVWIAPGKNVAILTCSNQGGAIAFDGSEEAITQVIKLFQN
jgi:CubicO group peptidase (beta-lactamase class C family)/class 3 adenylate cyclase